MGKNQDIEAVSNILAQAIIHKIVPYYTNKPELVSHMQKEEVEYRGQSFKKISKINWRDSDKLEIKEKVIKKVKLKLSTKYSDICIPEEDLLEKINHELRDYFSEFSSE